MIRRPQVVVGPHKELQRLRKMAERLGGSFHVDIEGGEVSFCFVRGSEMTDFSTLREARAILEARKGEKA